MNNSGHIHHHHGSEKDLRLPRRISAGGLSFKGDSVLLVRQLDRDSGQTYLVGPGGGLEDAENVLQAVVRETEEETGIRVRPLRVVEIEDLLNPRFKTIKVWMVCEYIEGELKKTPDEGMQWEGIVNAAWYTREQLAGEVVYPTLLMERDWAELRRGLADVEIPPSRVARF